MARLRIGTRAGSGPFVKIMANDSDDPLTTSNTDYQKFRFNSEVDAIGYLELRSTVTFNNVTANFSYDRAYYPAGTDETNCLFVSQASMPSGNYNYDINSHLARIFPELNAFHYFIRDAAFYRALYAYDNTNNVKLVYPVSYIQEVAGVRSYLNEFPALLPPGRNNGADTPELSGPNNSSYYRTEPIKMTAYQINLPIDDSAYPTTIGSFVSGKKILRIDDVTFKMAKPGYDIATATHDQLILDSDKIPMKVIKTGSFDLGANAEQAIDLGAAYSPSIFVDYQVYKQGGTLYIPQLDGHARDVLSVKYKIAGNYLYFKEFIGTPVSIRYFVMAQDESAPASGASRIIDSSGNRVVIRKPGTNGLNINDIMLDTEMTYMPIVAQGWVPFSSFTSPSDYSELSTHMYQVSFANSGWKPYVLARFCRRYHQTDGSYTKQFEEPHTYYPTEYDHFAGSSCAVKVTDTGITLYASDSSRLFQLADTTTLGARYYVFAVPNAL